MDLIKFGNLSAGLIAAAAEVGGAGERGAGGARGAGAEHGKAFEAALQRREPPRHTAL